MSVLETKLQAMHACQANSERLELALIDSSKDVELLLESATSLASLASCTSDLQTTNITTTNIIKSFKDVDETTIRWIIAYYARYRATWLVENLLWSTDMVLNTCEESLKDKVCEGLVGVLEMEIGGPLVLKNMLGIVMNVDDDALRSLIENLQSLRMKDFPGENVGTVVSYLKGVLLLLENCEAIPMDAMSLLNDVMSSADCQEFTAYMQSIYLASKRDNTVGGYMEYLDSAESKYRTLYRKGKYTKATVGQESGFVSDADEADYFNSGRGRGRSREYSRKKCNTCGRVGLLARMC